MDRYGFDPYDVLGVARDASREEIRARYRELLVVWHPDLSPHPDAHERTVAIVQAYTILGEPERRAEYDRSPDRFWAGIGDWIEERLRIWQVTECLRCGKPLYGGRAIWTAPDGSEYLARVPRRRDALFCSNACRQAAYRWRVKVRAAERQIDSRNAPPPLEP